MIGGGPVRADVRAALSRAGYTLVELLVVMTIILLIAGLLIVVIRKILQLIHTLFQSGLIV